MSDNHRCRSFRRAIFFGFASQTISPSTRRSLSVILFYFSMSALTRDIPIDDIMPVARSVRAIAGADALSVASARRQAADRV